MTRRLILITVTVFLLAVFCVCTQNPAFSSDAESENYVGPGKHETLLCIKASGNKNNSELYNVGKVAMWNTRDQFFINVEPDDGKLITDVRIYVGSDTVDISQGGSPRQGQFPYKESFKDPISSYELSLSLSDDLGFSWGRRDQGKRIQNVAVSVKLLDAEENDKNKTIEAWAYGENEFEAGGGWYSRYALCKPQTGHFVDAPVDGIGFKTPSQKGKTNSNGAFDYIPGEPVSFDLGSLHLGTAAAKHRVTPLDLIGASDTGDKRVINMARLLQSLDADGDPKRGIAITKPVIEECLEPAIKELNIRELDFLNDNSVNSLIEKTIENSLKVYGVNLRAVSAEEAKGNLEKGTGDRDIFRKNVSKTPEAVTAKAKIELMRAYVPAKAANGEDTDLIYYDSEANETERRDKAKPLVVVYADEIPGTGASDVFGAISRDEGNTWKVTNLSRSADKSSFKLKDGTEFPGDVLKPNLKVAGNYILAAWTSQYARSGQPRYSLPEDHPYYEDDIWGVSGPQRSTDYSEMGWPEVGELPYHCVWTCRGVIDEDTGDITWFKPERLTSGRRDAYQLMFNAVEDAGFALVWQEDPKGIRPGEQAGPGEGWSGATTNHKTDIWYSYIKWEDFAKIDEDFESGGDPQHDEDKEMTGRPKALVPFSLPVRISDNDMLNAENMNLKVDENGKPVKEDGNWVPKTTFDKEPKDNQKNNSGSDTGSNEEPGDGSSSGSGNGTGSGKDDSEEKVRHGSHRYGYMINNDKFSVLDFVYKVNHQGAVKWVAVTSDGRVLDGNTGASRPNIMMQKYQKPDGTVSAWAMICYEETKGVGTGPPEDVGGGKEDGNSDESDISILAKDDEKESSGEQRGINDYFPDNGKNVIYHSFDFTDPDLVSGGEILNPQATDENGNLLYLKDAEDGYFIDEDNNQLYKIDNDGNAIDPDGTIITERSRLEELMAERVPAYENARRPRLIVQSKGNALKDTEGKPLDEGTVMVCVFKMGEEGKGRPSDIFMRRWEVKKSDTGNPYSTKFLTDDIQNISSVTPLETWANPDSGTDGQRKRDPVKVIKWEQTEDNLKDHSWTNPYDDARAHRGFIKGNFLAIAYDWTPNWAAARNGNDVYNLYIRRSFDGGATWTTDPNGSGVTHVNTFKIYPEDEGDSEVEIGLMASEDKTGQKEKYEEEKYYGPGEFEPARNCSQLSNTKESVIEPRLVGVPGTISGGYDEDTQDPCSFWVTYGTESNPGRHSEEEGGPLDIYYSYSTDCGETYYTVTKWVYPGKGKNDSGDTDREPFEDTRWDWLAKDTGKKQAEQAECQIRMSPDGSVFYSVWNETGPEGSDVIFRRIARDGSTVESVHAGGEAASAIVILGINNGDVVDSDVTIDIMLIGETATCVANLYEDDILIDTFGINDVPYAVSPKDNSMHKYRLEVIVPGENAQGYRYRKQIRFGIMKGLQINIDGVYDGEITKEDKTITITSTGKNTTITLTKDGTVIPFNSGETLTEDGKYVLTVTSTTNNSLTKKVSFTIDKVAPTIAITAIVDGGTYTKPVTPEIIVTDNHSSAEDIIVKVQLNNNDFTSGTAISDKGSHILNVTAIDEAGNESTLAYTFKITSSSSGSKKSSSSGQKQDTPKYTRCDINHKNTTSFTTEDGKVSVLIPAGSTLVDAAITITAVEEFAEPDAGLILIDELIYQIVIKDENGNNITDFNKYLTIEFNYSDSDIPDGINEEDLKVCYWNEEAQTWIVIPTNVDTANNKLTFTINHLTLFAVMAVPGFPELTDIKGHWAEESIYKLVSMKAASGEPNGSFRPKDKISREEFVKLVVLAAGLEAEKDPLLSLVDENEIADWAKSYVASAIKSEIIKGYDDNTFRPKQDVSRAEIAIMVIKALKIKQLPAQPSANFKDANSIPKWAQLFVAKAVEEGIITGFPDETFRANDNATRAEAAVMISRMLNIRLNR